MLSSIASNSSLPLEVDNLDPVLYFWSFSDAHGLKKKALNCIFFILCFGGQYKTDCWYLCETIVVVTCSPVVFSAMSAFAFDF